MQKLLILILLIITTAAIFIPCCQSDGCCEVSSSEKEHTTNREEACSPFSACIGCSGFVQLSKSVQLIHPTDQYPLHHEKLEKFHSGVYLHSFWQPPRNC